MHEYSITSSIIDIIKKNIKGKNTGRVTKVNIELSTLSQIEPQSVRFYYQVLTKKEDDLKDAELVFERKPVKLVCGDCSRTSEIDNFLILCPRCRSRNVSLADTEEIRLVSVETKD
ncbi:MAG: hydrogenase maturation nickel metallochaperone HypA [Actinomycetota bacterium]